MGVGLLAGVFAVDEKLNDDDGDEYNHEGKMQRLRRNAEKEKQHRHLHRDTGHQHHL